MADAREPANTRYTPPTEEQRAEQRRTVEAWRREKIELKKYEEDVVTEAAQKREQHKAWKVGDRSVCVFQSLPHARALATMAFCEGALTFELSSVRLAQTRQEQREKRQQVAAYKLAKDEELQRQQQLQQVLDKPKCGMAKADVEARVQRGMESARQRHDRTESADQKRRQREEALKLAAKRGGAQPAVTSDVTRILKPTASSKSRGFTPDELDERDNDRDGQKAHERPIAQAARDLMGQGRAQVAWLKGPPG